MRAEWSRNSSRSIKMMCRRWLASRCSTSQVRAALVISPAEQGHVVQQDLAVSVWVKNWMVYCHFGLRQNGGNIVSTACASGIDLIALDLCAEVEPVSCRKLILHP